MAQGTGSPAAEILHTATVVLTIVTLTALAALACILITWATAGMVRRRRAHQQATLRSVKSDTQSGLAITADFNGAAFPPELSTRSPSPYTCGLVSQVLACCCDAWVPRLDTRKSQVSREYGRWLCRRPAGPPRLVQAGRSRICIGAAEHRSMLSN